MTLGELVGAAFLLAGFAVAVLIITIVVKLIISLIDL